MPHPTKNHIPISKELAELLAPRILARVEKRRNGCWVRHVNVHPKAGYTWIPRTVDRKTTYYLAHRVMYVAANGPIPDGLTVDHICNVTGCCNPKHLRAVPHRDNVLRGKKNPFAINARRDRCKRGHEYTQTQGKRRCLKCRAINRLVRLGRQSEVVS